MEAQYRGLGFDPTPGSVDTVASASDRFARAARHAESAVPAIEDAGTRMSRAWTGSAATSFGTALGRVPAELAGAGETLGAAAGVLDEWAATLRANQRRADRLDRDALELTRAIERADDDVASARTALQVAIGSAARTAATDHAIALANHARLRQDLDTVLEAAKVLQRDHLAVARRIAERLRALAGHGGAQAAGEVIRGDEVFGRIARVAGALSTSGGELALTLFGAGTVGGTAGSGHVPDGGAAARFAAALVTVGTGTVDTGGTGGAGDTGTTGGAGGPGGAAGPARPHGR